MAVSGDLEALNSQNFLARLQPWWRLVRLAPPPEFQTVPTPLACDPGYKTLANWKSATF
jgi:hypothetical protein